MKILYIIVAVIFLNGCSDANHTVKDGSVGDTNLWVYTVNSVPLECIYVGSGMSCNWEKHNKLKESK